MTTQANLERALDVFLAPDHDELAGRVLEAALEEIGRTNQRRGWPAPWRTSDMNASLRLATAAVVAVVAIALIGVNLAGKGGGGASPSASAMPTGSEAAEPTARAMVVERVMTPGSWTTTRFAAPFTVAPTNSSWTVLQDEPGSVFLTSSLATLQVIDVTDAITGCAPAGAMPPRVAWAPGNPDKAPAVLAGGANPPVPSDSVGAFIGWFSNVVGPAYRDVLTIESDDVTTIASRPATSLIVTNGSAAGQACPELTAGGGGYVPVVAFAPDDWFNVGFGMYRFTAVGYSTQRTILIITAPPERLSTLKGARSVLGAAAVHADTLLKTLAFTAAP